MNSILISRGFIFFAIGAGLTISQAVFYILLKLVKRMKKPLPEKNINDVDQNVQKFEELSSASKKSSVSNHRNSSGHSLKSWSSSSSLLKDSIGDLDIEDEMFSLVSSDTEYYDINSDELEEYEEVERLFDEVDKLLKGTIEDRSNASKLLQNEEDRLARNPDFLWRKAMLYQLQAFTLDDLEKKMDAIEQGLQYVQKALSIDPRNYDAHKWYAILVGMKAEFLPVREKIESGLEFEKHLSLALDGKPDDAVLHHLLGRFKYQIANLPWIERKLASALFANLPHFTMENALKHFIDADKLHPGWIENGLYVGKCYIALHDYKNANTWLDSAKKIQPVTAEDVTNQEEIVKLMDKYSKYIR